MLNKRLGFIRGNTAQKIIPKLCKPFRVTDIIFTSQLILTTRSQSFTRFIRNQVCFVLLSNKSTFFYFQLLQSKNPVKEEPLGRTSDKEVVVESGPVEYEKNDETNPVGEEEDFDELGEEDEEPVSAVHLMGHLYEAGKLLSRDTIMNQSLGFYDTKLIWRITTNPNSKQKLDCKVS